MILVGRVGPRRIVTAANAAARALGLRPGMPATQAQALVQDLLIHDADPREDAAALERLALWALKLYAPVVACDPPDGLLIDASGAAHLHGGEAAMLADLVGRLDQAGIDARAAMAATHGAAHALARYRAQPTLVVDNDATATALAELPIAALRLPADLVTALRRLGFDRIGELAAQPRAPLALRFGSELGRRLDQAYGRLAEPITPVLQPDLLQVRRAFAEPIGAAETLARYTGKLTLALCTMLDAKGLGARRLDLLFHRVDNRIEAIRVGTAKPVRDAKRLTRLLCDQLETIDPGFGVELMTLTAVITEPLAYRPSATALGEAPEADVASLVDTLVGRVGGAHLHRFAAAESDLPERSVRKVEALAEATPGRLAGALAAAGAPAAGAGADRDPGPAARSPARLLHLARHPPPRAARRRARADLRRVVSQRGRDGRRARLLPGRDRGRRALLAVSRRRRRGCRHRLATLVPAWRVRMSYAELQCTSQFSFLRGASSCEELFAQAAVLGLQALAITDRNSLAGIVRAHEAAKATGVRLIVGCRLDLTDGASLLVYPTDRPAYGRLCRLLSLGKRRGGKAKCLLGWEDVAQSTPRA